MTAYRRIASSRLLQKLRPQHQALDLVGASFDLVGVVGEMDVSDHGAALQHRGGALQLEVLNQRDAVALGESCAVGIPDLISIWVESFVRNAERALPFPLVGEGGAAKAAPDERSASAERTPHPSSLREATLSHKGRGEAPGNDE
jgi:hypothetical protein